VSGITVVLLSYVHTLVVPEYGISVTLHYSLSPFSYCYEYTFIMKFWVHSPIRWPVVVVVVYSRGCSVDRACFCKILLEFSYDVIASTIIISSIVSLCLLPCSCSPVCVCAWFTWDCVRVVVSYVGVLLASAAICVFFLFSGIHTDIENRIVCVEEYFVHMYVITICAVYRAFHDFRA
jgi:hypothetical protein